MTCSSPQESQQTTFKSAPVTKEAIAAAALIYASHKSLSYKDWFLLADWIGGLHFIPIQEETVNPDLAIALLTYHRDWNTTAAKMYFLKQHLTDAEQKDCAKCLLKLTPKLT